MVQEADIRWKILKRSANEKEYGLYRAGLEWDLTDPIILNSADDFKSTPRWQEKLTPYQHQVTNLITFCRRLPVTLLADDVGLGKTISAGLILSELVARSRVSKTLIVAPKLLGPQWKSELEKKFDISARVSIGRELLDSVDDDVGAVITTYNTARLYLEKLPSDQFQMLVLDEAHKLRNLFGTEKPPKVATTFQNVLQERRFKFVLMLTATPIQNRLWDLYSLVDLLTVARGHQNPFGSPGNFARRFIEDDQATARRLKQEVAEEFRSIVYGYMSRVRRGDARLHFPDRKVLRHEVIPSAGELELIKAIAEPIQKLNKLVQISILQALVSSPDALRRQLENMAMKGSVPRDFYYLVRDIVSRMSTSAKLRGLAELIGRLKSQDPDRWRLVVFTTRRETQTTIQLFLEEQGLKVGIINGDSGARNQQTIEMFKANPPRYRVIVSTEAGSEGVNLQVSNILVNYDLPWNPMIVEQRIGRVQRLGSEYAHVIIYNLTLKDTFEDYIVGRLLEKLQLASHAIGDLESLLQSSDTDSEDEDGGEKFEEKILSLVLAALAGKDIKKARELEIQSIDEAATMLERERTNIQSMLSDDGVVGYVGPRSPDLPTVHRSLSYQAFVVGALGYYGARLSRHSDDVIVADREGSRELIRFRETNPDNVLSTLYAPGSSAFQRLVSQVTSTGLFNLVDKDSAPEQVCRELCTSWLKEFDGVLKGIEFARVERVFNGSAVLRVRSTVAHDSYERLVEVPCDGRDSRYIDGKKVLEPVGNMIENPIEVGLQPSVLAEYARADVGIAEFSRFYLERREIEIGAARGDPRKSKKLGDEFTPRFDATVVGVGGKLHREIAVDVSFEIDGSLYRDTVGLVPSENRVVSRENEECAVSRRRVPSACLDVCAISGKRALRHLLKRSDFSDRRALPQNAARCSLSGKTALIDELGVSAVTGDSVALSLMKTSQVSGKRGEPNYFSVCEFTNADALKTELRTSDFSNKRYRADQEVIAHGSGKRGHESEFVKCHVTGHQLGRVEAERCEVTGAFVEPGILQNCEVSRKRVLPSELGSCESSSMRVLKSLLVESSVSGATVLRDLAVKSRSGSCCMLNEAQRCSWSGERYHPDDIKTCDLTGLRIFLEFLTQDGAPKLKVLFNMLAGQENPADESGSFLEIAGHASKLLSGARCRVEAGSLSPKGDMLAVSVEAKKFLGLRTYIVGGVYSLIEHEFKGRVSEGKRSVGTWKKA